MAVAIPNETKSVAGRKPNPIVYNELEDCVECVVTYNGNPLTFLIDKDDLEKVKTRNWHIATAGKYISTNVRIDGIIKVLYLHNFVMNKFDFPGRGTKQSIDHINRNGLDNRKQNLRLVTQTQQNLNRSERTRRAALPEKYQDSVVKIYDLPKHVYYVKARGNHGDGFCVEFKKDGKKIYNPYIRSKVLTIEQKLEKIKELLEKGYAEFPEFTRD
jgi:hypothetical protein